MKQRGKKRTAATKRFARQYLARLRRHGITPSMRVAARRRKGNRFQARVRVLRRVRR